MNYSIYTDGACSGNGKENATNNICELSAVFGACSFFDAYTPKEDTATI